MRFQDTPETKHRAGNSSIHWFIHPCSYFLSLFILLSFIRPFIPLFILLSFIHPFILYSSFYPLFILEFQSFISKIVSYLFLHSRVSVFHFFIRPWFSVYLLLNFSLFSHYSFLNFILLSPYSFLDFSLSSLYSSLIRSFNSFFILEFH